MTSQTRKKSKDAEVLVAPDVVVDDLVRAYSRTVSTSQTLVKPLPALVSSLAPFLLEAALESLFSPSFPFDFFRLRVNGRAPMVEKSGLRQRCRRRRRRARFDRSITVPVRTSVLPYFRKLPRTFLESSPSPEEVDPPFPLCVRHWRNAEAVLYEGT